ncbi:hypothetical protein LINGRAHAP2_LOCUS3503 [Linum grandiflorum]
MATGWVKSLQCKSRAFDDVLSPAPRSLSCRKSAQNIKDVIDSASAANRKKKNFSKPKSHRSDNPGPKPYPKPDPFTNRPATLAGYRLNKPETAAAMFPALKELPEGHPSRNVVEIIFHTSWSNSSNDTKSFSGRIEMIFKVENGTRTATRFEEYREAVKYRAGLSSSGVSGGWEENARCVADGNEMMRFYCLGPSTGGDTWGYVRTPAAAEPTRTAAASAEEEKGGGQCWFVGL